MIVSAVIQLDYLLCANTLILLSCFWIVCGSPQLLVFVLLVYFSMTLRLIETHHTWSARRETSQSLERAEQTLLM